MGAPPHVARGARALYHAAMNQTVSLQFRTATPHDVPRIVALVESAYRGDSGRRGWTTESDLLDGQRTDADEVSALVAVPDGAVLLAEEDGRLVASCHVERRGDAGYFGMFAVDPAQQDHGVGRAMLAHAEAHARACWHCSAMVMSVIVQRTELIAWYGRRGYRPTGEYLPFPYGDARFGLPRRDDLRFEVLRKDLGAFVA